MRIKHVCILAVAGAWSVLPVRAEPVTQDDFLVRTTQDLIALCGAAQSDPLYTAAIHFCHGYVIGALHYNKAIEPAVRTERIVCLPDPPPSREQGIQNFVAWANQNPQYMNEFPVNTLFRFVAMKWPCR